MHLPALSSLRLEYQPPAESWLHGSHLLENKLFVSLRDKTQAHTITLDSHQGPNGSGNEEDELESITSDLPDVELYRRAPPASRALSTTSTDIEIMRAPADMQGPERSPARKIARSPVNGLDRSISRLNFNQRRRPAASVSPQRKRGGSQASTVDHSHGPAGSAASDVPEGAEEIEEEPPFRGSARNLPNLNAAGLALTMDEFLDHCNFSRDNHTPRVLIGLSQVHHWDFSIGKRQLVIS
ncbi:hypothetical protein Pst134EB_002379 [Puccinia striiformis f. sp. tritici]|nr:hypothetical protein Pst134EB_002379 [Puccinia striiformis f. sp. tritici]